MLNQAGSIMMFFSFPFFPEPSPDMNVSRTIQKKQAKQLEELAMELVTLSRAELAALPADEPLKAEILESRDLKGGARKRQVKYIAKNLRHSDPEPLFEFLAQRKGSKLKEDQEIHELERLRDAIIGEAIAAYQEAQASGLRFLEQEWQSESNEEAAEKWPKLEKIAVHRAATRFAVTRKPAYKKDIFRQLKTAKEKQQFNAGKES
jgi:ribosome-associated protein